MVIDCHGHYTTAPKQLAAFRQSQIAALAGSPSASRASLDISDDEIVEGIRLLGETEGIFTETAGGVTVAVARKLIRQGRLNPDESIVLTITGNGLKTIGALQGKIPESALIRPKLDEFEEQFLGVGAATAA